MEPTFEQIILAAKALAEGTGNRWQYYTDQAYRALKAAFEQ